MAKGNVAAAEPSMEEILASIRRIIADEEPAAPPEPQAATAAEDILDLGAAEGEMIEDIPPKAIDPVDMDDLSFDAVGATSAPANDWAEPPAKAVPRPAATPVQSPVPQAYAPPPAYTPPPPQPSLVSAHTGAAVNAAFNSLASAIFSSSPRTIEDLTKDMLQPLLKQWLDDNLPSLVERIVRDEIERVARGRR